VVDPSVYVAPGAVIIGDVVIGPESSIWFGTVVRADVHYIRIGAQTNIQDQCILHVTGGTHPLNVGNRITVGHRAIIHGCTIEDGCLIGMGAVLLDGKPHSPPHSCHGSACRTSPSDYPKGTGPG